MERRKSEARATSPLSENKRDDGDKDEADGEKDGSSIEIVSGAADSEIDNEEERPQDCREEVVSGPKLVASTFSSGGACVDCTAAKLERERIEVLAAKSKEDSRSDDLGDATSRGSVRSPAAATTQNGLEQENGFLSAPLSPRTIGAGHGSLADSGDTSIPSLSIDYSLPQPRHCPLEGYQPGLFSAPEIIAASNDADAEHVVSTVEHTASSDDGSSSGRSDSDTEENAPFATDAVVAVSREEMEDSIRNRILSETVRAEAISFEKTRGGCSVGWVWFGRREVWIALVMTALCIFAVVLSEGLSREEHPGAQPRAPVSTLDDVKKRGVLKCDRVDMEFLKEMCRAISAAIFGDPTRVEFVDIYTDKEKPIIGLATKSVDVLIGGLTHTMERDVYEVDSIKGGLTFSDPFMYGGLSFGGVPPFSKCADDLDVSGKCADLQICVPDIGGTWMDIVEALIPASNIVSTSYFGDETEKLNSGKCNALAGERQYVTEVAMRKSGFNGTWELGSRVFSKEPLAAATLQDDPQWSFLVGWVIRALLVAEKNNITQATARKDIHGLSFLDEKSEERFRNIISAVGNYGEIFDRYMSTILPRERVNEINTGDTGLIYSHPFGANTNAAPGPVEGGTLDRVAERGKLLCGISQDIFVDIDEDRGGRLALDSDFCRAVATSAIFVKTKSVEFVEFASSDDAFKALASGDVDVVAGGILDLESASRNELEASTFSYSQPYFYESTDSSLRPEARALITRNDDAQWSDFVYWIVSSIFYAEEEGITQKTSNEMPGVIVFGDEYNRMFRDAILAVGNYDEVYSRNMFVPRSGRNLLNTNPLGPQHYVFPLI